MVLSKKSDFAKAKAEQNTSCDYLFWEPYIDWVNQAFIRYLDGGSLISLKCLENSFPFGIPSNFRYVTLAFREGK